MTSPVNIVQLVQDLPSRPRGRACAVLTQQYQGQKEWAAELARQTDSEHLDLLELFAQDEKLSEGLGGFGVPELFAFLGNRSQAPVLIVSGLEFLKASWIGQSSAVEQFASRMETWDRQPALVFVLQHDGALATRPFRRFRQYTFVVDQRETLAL